jgi:hypothetical protein
MLLQRSGADYHVRPKRTLSNLLRIERPNRERQAAHVRRSLLQRYLRLPPGHDVDN